MKRITKLIAAVITAAVFFVPTTAFAAIPNSATGYINTCYRDTGGFVNPQGSLRVVDTQAGQSCTAQETALNIPGTNAFVQGGNSFGTEAVLGTDDVYDLIFQTDGNERFRIDSTGKLSIMSGQIWSAGLAAGGQSNDFEVLASSSVSPEEEAGSVMLTAGDAFATEFEIGGNGGNIYLQAGHASNNNAEGGMGGDVILSGGTGYYGYRGGNINLAPGNSGSVRVLSAAKTTLYIGSTMFSSPSTVTGCLVIGDSDGNGVTYITANDGALTASASKPSICED